MYLTLGKDFSAKSSYSGTIGSFNVNLGEGAYREGTNFEKGDDVFGIAKLPFLDGTKKPFVGGDDSSRPPIRGDDGKRPIIGGDDSRKPPIVIDDIKKPPTGGDDSKP